MNSVRVGAGVGILDNILYAIGGKIHSNNLSTCEKYDPVTNTWFPITSKYLSFAFDVYSQVTSNVGNSRSQTHS